MKLCLVMRGLPGAGLTTLSKEIMGRWDGTKTSISIDDYFRNHDKTYDKASLSDAYKYCFALFKVAIENQLELVIVDNSNIREYNYSHFVDYAQRNGYMTGILIIPTNHLSNRELAERNAHGKSELTIKKMRKSFEWKFES